MGPTTRASAHKLPAVPATEESDYGSDIDENTLQSLLVQAESQPMDDLVVIGSIEEHNSLPPAIRLPNPYSNNSRSGRRRKVLVDEDGLPFEVPDNDGPIREPSVEVEYAERNRVTFSPGGDERQRKLFAPFEEQDPHDARSPLARFRTAPKKPMSVTDIVSPAWCELQYLYSLSKYGRVKATPAMKQGSSIHKELEEEMHIAVPVETVTREDMFALRIWNIIQGLRTLRATGMTREMEVWGVIEGQVVNGVIDELSYRSPDAALEASLQERKRRKGAKETVPAVDQSTLNFSVKAQGAGSLETDTPSSPIPQLRRPTDVKRVYITDIKTRGHDSVPTDEVSLRPAFIQMMLYRRLLTQLCTNQVPSSTIFARYRVSPDAAFSDSFVAQIANLDHNFPPDIPPDRSGSDGYAPALSSPRDSMTELLAHNSLSALWDLMQHEHRLTLPAAAWTSPVAELLQVEYRARSTGKVLGKKVFVHDERRLESHVRDEMAWWKGEREVRGVEMEEAFKCRFCSFAEGCEWRKGKVVEGVEKMRVRREGRKTSVV